jgi:RNA polymerase sigma-70 factor, ECF subfamily
MVGQDSEAAAILFPGLAIGSVSDVPEDRLSPDELNSDFDRNLIRRIAAGDPGAMRELYAVYGGRMYAFALRVTGGAAAAEDVLQECLLAVWRGAGRFRGESRVLTWLLGIVHHKAADSAGERRISALPDDVENTFASLDPRPEERLLIRERESLLREGLERLPLAQRAALDLIFYQGLSLQEAAVVCECPLGTIKSRLNSAKCGLRRILERDGLKAEELR